MRKGSNYIPTQLEVSDTYDCVSMEEFLRKAIAGKEPIKAGAKVTYNDRKDGVLPQHDIRTDRFEMAMLATDKIHASQYGKRMEADGFVQNDKGEWIKPAADITAPVGEA